MAFRRIKRVPLLSGSVALVVSLLLTGMAQHSVAGPLGLADALGEGVEGGSLIVANDGDVIVTYLGSSAGFTNALYFEMGQGKSEFLFNSRTYQGRQRTQTGYAVNLGSFDVGTELIFRLFVSNRGNSFFTGDASRNADGVAHALATTQSSDGMLTTKVGFEDIFNGGDMDFNDLKFGVSNVSTQAPGGGGTQAISAPYPLTLVILGLGLLAAPFAGWRGRMARG